MNKRDFSLRLKLRDELRRAAETLAANPSASVSLSSGGGSKSVSYTKLSDVLSELRSVETEINEFKRSVLTGGSIDVNYARWCSR